MRHNSRGRLGFRWQFFAKQSSRYVILWSALILFLVSLILPSLWNDGGQTRSIRDTSNQVNIRRRRSGLYTIDDTSEFLNCTIPSIANFPDGYLTSEQRQHGGMLVNLAVVLYMFVALAVVCDEYFMPSLQLICDDLHLREDVAGATFMSIGGSAPELFASIIGVFVAKGDIGIGTIVGSAVFNLLFVIGLCGLVAGKEILLTCWPLIRDSSCYIITIGALAFAVADTVIHWYDSVMLLLLYLGYLTVMYFNEDVEHHVTRWVNENVKSDYKKAYQLERHHVSIQNGEGDILLKDKIEVEDEDTIYCKKTNQLDGKIENHLDPNNNKSEEDSSVFDVPSSLLRMIPWLISLPMFVAFYLTIPDPKKKRWRRCYPITFVIALLWIGSLTFILVWMVTVIGYELGINDTIMGLTLLAAGASTPDTILSVIAAREGFGDMAVSHSIGSNIFDILIGLGVPWFIKTVIIKFDSKVTIYSGAILYISVLLLLNVVALVAAITFLKFKLNCKLGIVLLFLFFAFITLSLLFEMNYIIPGLTLPVCELV
ncbi:sodium/potassium/calcium exchanger 5-like [Apostichopus japonicus]|uniref:sodium/potassium/calcium exchanger 5-like n=1 Tax=Stichopus japonicus TaxID=307972 RepID=UPI003AB70189